VWAPLSTGSQVLAGAQSSAGSPQGHSFFQAFTYSGVGSLPWAAGAQPALPWSSPWAAGESLLWRLEHLLPLLLH